MQEFVCLAFSADDKFIMSVTGAPEWMATFWSLEKGEVIAECQVSYFSNLDLCRLELFISIYKSELISLELRSLYNHAVHWRSGS